MPHLTPPQKIIGVFVALTLVVGGIIVLARQHPSQPTTSGQSAESKAAEKADVDAKKKELIESDKSDDTAPNTVTPTEQIPTQQNLTAQITSLNQSEGNITIAGSITGTTQAATCSFDFTTPNDKPVSRSIKGVVSGDQIACGPVSIPEVSFSYLGDWTAKLTYFIDGDKSTSAQRTINIK